jgi:flavin reductase (DIM6/NTAB) family NADH-FMN oxidoreductase RutF
MEKAGYISLDTSTPIWSRFFMVAPLIVVGSRGEDGYDLAPKHMAFPAGFDNYFGFVCTPAHATYRNIQKTREFTISFPVAEEVMMASLSATSREEVPQKESSLIDALPTLQAESMDLPFLKDSYLRLECSLFKIIGGFGENGIITGRIEVASVKEEYLRISERDEQQQLEENNLLCYLPPGRFARIRETYNFPFPKKFRI